MVIDDDNFDSASIELVKFEDFHQITFWDGYSQSEIVEAMNERDSAKTLKRFMKKLIKILKISPRRALFIWDSVLVRNLRKQ